MNLLKNNSNRNKIAIIDENNTISRVIDIK